MTNFVPPPNDRKKKDRDEEGGEEDVSTPPLPCDLTHRTM